MSTGTEERLELYATREQLARRVGELADALATQLRSDPSHERDPLLIATLSGGVIFAADLCRLVATRHTIELVELMPYAQARRDGRSRINYAFPPTLDVADRDVVLVDGIVDSGLMLRHLVREVERRRPRSLSIYVLFDRPTTRLIDLPLANVGFDAPNELLVGYGLTHQGRHAQLPDVYRLRAV